eukprot:TRINITY_DN1268_c0_g2_i8.p1 TRINITY_DN1268_c0_g2~~TRINITY_DN1268_c0_g2_i8.p1  ORF type:complete len:777 (-),score=178.74 TRINITY_DN1268_c0_g2_i8:51-2381(-)
MIRNDDGNQHTHHTSIYYIDTYRRLKLLFELGNDKLSHVYDLKFESPRERERFYALLSLLRSNARCNVNTTKLGITNVALPHLPGATEAAVETVSVLCGTWNLGSAPPPDNLVDWLVPNIFDIYAFGVQESNYASGEEGGKHDIMEHIKRAFNPKTYQTLALMSLWEIRIIILVKTDLLPKISNIETGKKATGLFNKLGNKGGVAISFRVNDTPLCFVNCHLAAGQDKINDRNDNVKDIFNSLTLGEGGDMCMSSAYFFWFGDLNYRINLSYEVGVQQAYDRNIDSLVQQDQLVHLMAANKVLSDFKEPRISFPPTYRYRRGCRKYSVEKSRVPSYCDRILVWSNANCDPPVLSFYNSVDSVMTSDHSPVHAAYNIPTKLYVVPKSFIPMLPFEDMPSQIVFGLIYLMDISPECELRKADQLLLELSSPSIIEGVSKTTIIAINTTTSSFGWKQSEIPVLTPYVNARELLTQKNIQVSIVNAKRRDEYREPYGYATIPLANAIDNTFEFRQPVYCAGLRVATIRGSISVRFGMSNSTTFATSGANFPLAMPTPFSNSPGPATVPIQLPTSHSAPSSTITSAINQLSNSPVPAIYPLPFQPGAITQQVLSSHGWTPLHNAAAIGDFLEVERLLNLGLDPASETNDGTIALHYFVSAQFEILEHNRAIILRVLDALSRHSDLINYLNHRKESPLHYVAKTHDNTFLLHHMLKLGADPNLGDKRGNTPLHYAVIQKHKSVVRVLLEHNADRNFSGSLGTPNELAKRVGADMIALFDEFV